MVTRKGSRREDRFERSNSINVAVNGISMPLSEGKVHQHIHGTNRGQAKSSTRPTSMSKSRSQSRGRRKLDDFLQSTKETSNLKKLGTLNVQKRDDLTDVAVSTEAREPDENNQAEDIISSLRPNSNPQKSSGLDCQFVGQGKHANIIERSPKRGVMGEKTKEEGAFRNEDLTMSLQRLEELMQAKSLAVKGTTSSELYGGSALKGTSGGPCHHVLLDRSPSISGPSASADVRMKECAVVDADVLALDTPESQVLSQDPQKGDGQSSSTIRRVKRKGRLYREVITVVSKTKSHETDDFQPSRGPIASDEALATRKKTTHHVEENEGPDNGTTIRAKLPYCDQEKTSAFCDQEKNGANSKHRPTITDPSKGEPMAHHTDLGISHSNLQKCNSNLHSIRHLDSPATIVKPQATSSANDSPQIEPQTLTNSNALNVIASRSRNQNNLPSGICLKRRSPAFRSALLSMKSSTTRTWNFGSFLSPRWLAKRSVEHDSDNQSLGLCMSLSVTPPANSSADKQPERAITTKLVLDSRANEVQIASAQSSGRETSPKKSEEKVVDDDMSSLFRFPSADSADKDLGDIFSFISSMKASVDVEEVTKEKDQGKNLKTPFVSDVPEATGNRNDISSVKSPIIAENAKTTKRALGTSKKEKLKTLLAVGRQSRATTIDKVGLDEPVCQTTNKTTGFLSGRSDRPNNKQGLNEKCTPDPIICQNEGDQMTTARKKLLVIDTKETGLPKRAPSETGHGEVSSPQCMSEALSQSASVESGAIFDMGGLFTALCGPDGIPRNEEYSLAWKGCGQSRDENSLAENSKSYPRTENSTYNVKLYEIVDHQVTTYVKAASIHPETWNPYEGNERYDGTKSVKPTGNTALPDHQTSEGGVDSIETVLQSTEDAHTASQAANDHPLRGVLSSGNISVANGTVLNVRVTICSLRGVTVTRAMKLTSNNIGNQPVVVGFARVAQTSSLAAQSMDVAKSRPLDLLAAREKSSVLPPILWGSKSVVDKRRGSIYFPVVLKQRYSDGKESSFTPEDVCIVIGLERGDEIIRLGTATLTIDGEESIDKRLDLPVRSDVGHDKKQGFFASRKNILRTGAFRGEGQLFGLVPDSVLSARVDVKIGDPDVSGPLVWDDYGGDEASFDGSYNHSTCDEQPTENYDSVEVVPMTRGSAIITKFSNVQTSSTIPRPSSGSDETVSATNLVSPTKLHNDPKLPRSIIPKLFRRKKTGLPKRPPFPRSTAKVLSPKKKVLASYDDEGGGGQEVPERDTLLSPISESQSECSFSADWSHEAESSDDDSSSRMSRRRPNLTDKAADWVYRGAKAAGFFSYSSEDEKLTEFSFSTKGDVPAQTSDLSDSVASDEASGTVDAQLKFWIQTDSLSSHEEGPSTTDTNTIENTNTDTRASERFRAKHRASHGASDNANARSLEQFKKILLLAQKLNMSPYELIKRLEDGDRLEMLKRK